MSDEARSFGMTPYFRPALAGIVYSTLQGDERFNFCIYCYRLSHSRQFYRHKTITLALGPGLRRGSRGKQSNAGRCAAAASVA